MLNGGLKKRITSFWNKNLKKLLRMFKMSRIQTNFQHPVNELMMYLALLPLCKKVILFSKVQFEMGVHNVRKSTKTVHFKFFWQLTSQKASKDNPTLFENEDPKKYFKLGQDSDLL